MTQKIDFTIDSNYDPVSIEQHITVTGAKNNNKISKSGTVKGYRNSPNDVNDLIDSLKSEILKEYDINNSTKTNN